ncbi:Na+/H+ antiporter [Caulobacter sp. NIBR2454]|uniref:Na+/H+ antiporter n=1 Tax=Caulobacter sp. NIBR2454 TaxID=3015996 RepID=UPI0022B69053|nr:Na+/H+ antiporter [Caulobacter sp. NIBR2454]
MAIVTLVLLLLLAVAASGFLARMLPVAVPLPLVQVALGAAIAGLAGVTIDLRPEIFFLLILPPLLFLDGWRIPKHGLMRDARPILQLALGLVVFTVVGVGWFIHWLIPAIPLPVAFALAAVLAPTDPVAVSAITRRTPFPERLMRILEAESLLNDASGLVCLRFAVAAAVTGVFSLPDAMLTFLWLALGGVAVGAGFTLVVSFIKARLARRFGEDPGAEVLISLLIPLGAYLAAEALHCSGILAAVAAGVAMSFAEIGGQLQAGTRVRRSAVWDTVAFTANGAVFVLLGQQMPSILEKATRTVRQSGQQDAWWLLVYVLAITLALAALRFVWVWVSIRLAGLRHERRGEAFERPSWRMVAAISLAGVRGAVSLAGVLTIPFFVADGSPMPARNLVIFLVAGVILVSLILAAVALPWAMKGLVASIDPDRQGEEGAARVAAAKAAIRAIERAQHELPGDEADADLQAEAAARIMGLYRRRIDGHSREAGEAALIQKLEEIDRDLRLAALQAERDELFRLVRRRALKDDIARDLVREIDLMETRWRSS